MKKILFFIHDLGHGGAEKVLVNLVNNMDKTKYDITVIAIFGGGVNEQFLAPHIHYKAIYKRALPGNSKLMKLLSPKALHKKYIKDIYDIEVAYLEGPAARIISGCPNKDTILVSWIHSITHSQKQLTSSYRSLKETKACYSRFDRVVCVSQAMKENFSSYLDVNNKTVVLYNTVESEKIKSLSEEKVESDLFSPDEIKLVFVGKIFVSKGFERMAHITKRLRDEGFPVHFYALGVGPDKEKIENYLVENNLTDYYTFLGYQTNPYKYVARCDLFTCASFSEGFSTSTTEALIVGTPVCTVVVSGMKEMLGENNEYGIVTQNDEQSLYEGIKTLVTNKELLTHYKKQTEIRGKSFSTQKTVASVEDFFEGLKNEN